jgi:hypothetical protein
VSRIRVAVLASASTLASVAVTEVHGAAIAIMAGCAALATGAAAWSSSEHKEKIEHYRHKITQKKLRFLHRAENSSTFAKKLAESRTNELRASSPRFAAHCRAGPST